MSEFREPYTWEFPPNWKRNTLTVADGCAKSLEVLLTSSSLREASNPKDYVHANLAMVIHDRMTLTDGAIVPDYAKRTKDIYTEAMKFITRFTQTLNIITYAQQPEFRGLRNDRHNIRGLPSWVPQYNHIGPSALAYDTNDGCKYRAMDGTLHLGKAAHVIPP